MAERQIVQWQNSYSVGVKLIDEQHMELIKLTNKLFANCMAGHERSRSTFLDTIGEVVDYTGYHFGTEEKVMERINYPEFSSHKMEHANFVKEVYGKIEDFKAGKLLAPLNFVYFLRDWVLHHIAVRDKKLGNYLLNLHRTGELHKMTVQVRKDAATGRFQFR